jgi:hypothetical protein
MPPSEAIPLNLPPATAFNTFRVEKQSHPGRQRAKFGSQRRREVEAVRRKGACLRCSVLRIPVGFLRFRVGRVLMEI